jgi:uncharacterized membrane protein
VSVLILGFLVVLFAMLFVSAELEARRWRRRYQRCHEELGDERRIHGVTADELYRRKRRAG